MKPIEKSLINKLKFSASINDTNGVDLFYQKYYDYVKLLPGNNHQGKKEVSDIYINYLLRDLRN